MRQSSPPPLDHTVLAANAAYHDRIAAEYERDISTAYMFSAATQTQIKTVVGWLRRHTAGERWLDVGCGTGNILRFASQSFQQALGLDISRGMLSVAQRRGYAVGQSPAQVLPLPTGAVDVVSTFSVLHHLYDPGPFLTEISRVLKPGGYFYSDLDPNGRCLIRHPVPRSIYRWLYSSYLRLTTQAASLETDPELARLQMLAEYHQNQTTGLDPYQLGQTLRRLGFTEVRVELSFGMLNPTRLDQPPAAASLVWPRVAPLFTLLARR